MSKKADKNQDQITELTVDLQRVTADFANFKRRSDEDKHHAIQFGRSSAVVALLPVIDDVERALVHVPKELENNDWALGVRKVAKKLEDALKGLGVEKIQSVGKEFNPDFHEAVSMEDGEGKKEVVAEELQPGYTLDGEVIRHAMVKVRRK